MERTLETLELTIPAGRTLRIRNAAGATIRLGEGTGWITEDGNAEDYVLAAGDVRRIGTTGLTLVHAFEESRLAIEARNSAVHVQLGAGYREYASGVWREQVRYVARRALRLLQSATSPSRTGPRSA